MKITRVSIFKIALVLSLLSLSTLEVLAAEVRQPVHVYFFTGGFIDVFSRETVKKIKTKTQNIGRDLEIPVKFERHWFTNWRSVSKKIQADHSKAKVVLLGHSWGAAGAVHLARDLDKKNIPVDLLVTIDTVSVPGASQASTIPANVRVNYNFYEGSDLFLHGLRKNKRKGSSSVDGIHNVKVLVGPTFSPHMTIDDKIEPLVSCQIKLLMLDQLDQLNIPDQLDKKHLAERITALEESLSTN